MYAPDGGGTSLRAAGLAVYERTEQAARALAGLASLAEARVSPAPLPLPEPATPLVGAGGLRRGARVARRRGAAVSRRLGRERRGRSRRRGEPSWPVPRHPQGRRPLPDPQVRPGRGPCRPAGRGLAARRCARAGGRPLARAAVRGADGRCPRRRRADRRRAPGRSLRPGRAGRPRRHARRGARGHRARARTDRRGLGDGTARIAARRGAAAWRPGPPGDRSRAAAAAVAALSRVAAAHPEIAELEVNPCSSRRQAPARSMRARSCNSPRRSSVERDTSPHRRSSRRRLPRGGRRAGRLRCPGHPRARDLGRPRRLGPPLRRPAHRALGRLRRGRLCPCGREARGAADHHRARLVRRHLRPDGGAHQLCAARQHRLAGAPRRDRHEPRLPA